jgi:pimeloyl-ACP methyl ester carboxylesterase
MRAMNKWWLRLVLPTLIVQSVAVVAPVQAKAPKDTPAALLQRIQKLAPGKERDETVDALIDHGDAAWNEVKTHLDALATLKDGEDVLVDLLLGFGLTSYDEMVLRLPKLTDPAARRIARQLLSGHYPKDDRQLQALTGMVAREDDELLLLILPEVLARNPTVALARTVALIDDKRPNLRAYAVDTLVAQHYQPAIQPMVRLLGIEQVKATAENLNLRLKLINGIARLSKGIDVGVDPLIAAVEVPDQREAALDGLTLIGAPAVKAAIFLLRTADRGRVETALTVLSHLRQQAAPELLPLLQVGDERTRGLAMDVLAHIAVPDVRAEIIRLVKAKRFPDMRQGIQLALTLYDESVRQMLFDLLADKDPGVRLLVIEELWNLQDPEAFLQMRTTAARDPDVHVRMAAAKAVAGTGDPKATEFLRRMIEVQDTQERVAVLELLGRIDDLGAVPALARLLGDPSDIVFRTTLSALRRLTFHAGPRRESEWLAWQAAEKAKEPEPFEKIAATLRKYAVDGRERAYLEVDEDDDRTIVVLSGAPFRDASHLAPHVYRLADDYRILVMRRGVGDGTAAGQTDAERTADLDKLLEKAGVDKAVLLADPAGAHFAMTYAALRPKKVSHVILHGGPWPTPAAIERLPGEVAEAMLPPWRDDAIWALRQHAFLAANLQRRTVMRGVLTALVNDVEQARKVKADNLYDDAFTIDAQQRATSEALNFDPRQVAVPTLVLLGDKAPWAASTIRELATLTGPAKKFVRAVKIPDSKGFPLLDNPTETTRQITEFLK